MDPRRIAALCLLAALVVAPLAVRSHARAQRLPHAAGTLYAPGELSIAQRAAGLRFGPEVPAQDRERTLAAIAAARPDARALIGEVDGLVTVHDGAPIPGAVGLATLRDGRLSVRFDDDALDRYGPTTARHVILHELGHIVDFALVPDALLARLDRGVPRTRACPSSLERTGPCTVPEERFADTFAKWALGTAGPPQWIGYGVEAPLSLEAWGRPLAALARDYATNARSAAAGRANR